MIKKTEDRELWELIQKGLNKNKEKYGKRYCPCSLIRTQFVCVKNLEMHQKEPLAIVEFTQNKKGDSTEPPFFFI